MFDNAMQWVAVVIEFIGLLLITVELYMPGLSESLKALFEETKPAVMKNPYKWIASYILLWIAAVFGLYALDPSTLLMVNVFFTVVTTLTLVLLGVSRMLVRLGVVLGRGNSVGGVGLVLALIGFTIEVGQLL